MKLLYSKREIQNLKENESIPKVKSGFILLELDFRKRIIHAELFHKSEIHHKIQSAIEG